jgi:hypothetical protein
LLCGIRSETVKEVKWIDQNSNEGIGASIVSPFGEMTDPFTRILVRFVNRYEDGIPLWRIG